ncbi:MAG TPA: conjugal transfer protein TrbL [Hydrogenophaga sp.]|uniref:type IV secretion system protein n=1 Tax=Hydrogenophaga sp. TaxID=1904254 RepID=UPI0008C641AD|nr:type IV secretion system protein [Hydrogenophaga sp.]OGA79714.1 MAG: conjugal transfer protein TrbL [Burkholderiales bacterium GWE1_65_30]OGA92629.1 MAG: conjugal transfer protein TrbL [Burkholderiales bacterium GWF1_66_17]HAX22018.1 conjugal transfer protein TrbL [Hydrogenophaga sp.]HBU21156.1 conjugal transfer protein TrbL [Hydrogenophaga sp.]
MFAWVGSQFDAILSSYVLGVVSALMAAIAPIALTAMTIWVALYGWAVLRNEVSETVPTFVWKVFKIGLVLAFALQSGFYISNVSDTANALAMGVASTFLPSGVDPSTVSSPYALLDKFNDDASAQVADIMKEASMFRLDLVLAGAIFSIGSVLFLCIGLFVVTLAKLFLTFVIAVGPLFILCLAWRPTARFFDSWMSMVLNAVVLTWFAFFALGLSAFMGNQIFLAIHSGGGFLGSTFNVLGEATRYCVLMILMAILCFQAPSLASALTGGAAIQQGIQMIQNAMMVSGLRSSRGTGAASGEGGVIRSGTGLPYAAGVAAGSTGRYASAMARRSYGAARSAAYKLAAQRGRS